ncbi:MAG: hypothetical protein LQ345_003377 [Seirophora villosa]|nr:MAG: hypothetical protein LQ345_003377 [Seirophora villosa]
MFTYARSDERKIKSTRPSCQDKIVNKDDTGLKLKEQKKWQKLRYSPVHPPISMISERDLAGQLILNFTKAIRKIKNCYIIVIPSSRKFHGLSPIQPPQERGKFRQKPTELRDYHSTASFGPKIRTYAQTRHKRVYRNSNPSPLPAPRHHLCRRYTPYSGEEEEEDE